MGLSTEASVLAALEQAEMAARERRLTASNKADAVMSDAEQSASAVRARAGRRVDEALEALRGAAEADAEVAIEELERAAARQTRVSPGSPRADPAIDDAVAMVVARVLGEAPAGASDEEHA